MFFKCLGAQLTWHHLSVHPVGLSATDQLVVAICSEVKCPSSGETEPALPQTRLLVVYHYYHTDSGHKDLVKNETKTWLNVVIGEIITIKEKWKTPWLNSHLVPCYLTNKNLFQQPPESRKTPSKSQRGIEDKTTKKNPSSTNSYETHKFFGQAI